HLLSVPTRRSSDLRPVREIPELPAHFARQSAVEDGGTRRDAQQRAGGAEARRIGSAPASLRTTTKKPVRSGAAKSCKLIYIDRGDPTAATALGPLQMTDRSRA